MSKDPMSIDPKRVGILKTLWQSVNIADARLSHAQAAATAAHAELDSYIADVHQLQGVAAADFLIDLDNERFIARTQGDDSGVAVPAEV